MVVCVVLSILAAIAGMNGRTSWMGLAVVGTVAMLIVQACQVAAAVVVHRWWCVAGSLAGIVVSLFVITCSIVAMAAGQYSPPVYDRKSGEEVPDSITFSQDDEQLACSIVVLVPDASVKEAVGEWLSCEFGSYFTGDVTDLQALVDFYGQSHVDSLRSIKAEGVPDFADLCYEVYMDKVFETDKVVTYGLTITLDLGGAHPTTREVGATFVKDDGKRLTWDIVRDESKPQLQALVQEMLKDYFNVTTDDELREYLLEVDNVKDILLPVTPPYMTENGFVFIYQQYEIAAYAAGIPGDTIAYERLEPSLREDVKQLLPY